ncbi:pilus assembly protein PilM, partial [Candidatus Saccharibacteria bacterium]|nr:pilus assembly protein PilM [Candidatus Saccharibacteria bacterium]
LEAEQYIPVPVSELYLDHMIIDSNAKETELLVVAVPKKIVDSYLVLANMLNLEVAGLETSIGATARIFVHSEQSDVPTVLVDFGSISSDISIYDKSLIVTGTVAGGGDNFTELIASALNINKSEATVIKTKYGIGVSKKQREISKALVPILNQLIKEVRRMIRYYEDRSNTKRKVSQVVTMGGGASMPGLSEFMTSSLRLPVRMCDPWLHLDFAGLQPPSGVEKSTYTTVAGLALVDPKEILA